MFYESEFIRELCRYRTEKLADKSAPTTHQSGLRPLPAAIRRRRALSLMKPAASA